MPNLHITKLDHLRFFAAALVMTHHFRNTSLQWDGKLSPESIAYLWIERGGSGVSF
jgi:peptidoglycan/LPS O-acetylase OafA/YrhL